MNTTETMLKMIFDRWQGSIKNLDTLLSALTDEQLYQQMKPGKNRGIYLLGHLIAVHDDMFVLLNMGEKLYPELNEPFLKAPDTAIDKIPSAQELRNYWSRQCEVLAQKFKECSPDDWFSKHTAVSAEDFIKEPNRNKLNIVLTRTTHLAYHTGQLRLLQ